MTVSFFNFRQVGYLNTQMDQTTMLAAEQDFAYFFNQNQTSSVVIGLACHDCAPESYQYIAQHLYQHCVDRGLQLIIIADAIYQHHILNWPSVDIYYVNYWPMMVERHSKFRQQQYNPTANQLLCLTGTMDRINRIGIVAAFYKRGCIDSIRYSWMLPSKEHNILAFENSKKICNDLGVNIDDLILHSATAINDTETSMLLMDLPQHKIFKLKEKQYNLQLQHWAETKFSIVNETVFKDQDHFSVTEKTWSAIYNKHPFFILNHPGANHYMNQHGVSTIDSLLDPNFDFMPLDKQKLNQAVTLSHMLLNDTAHNCKLQDLVESNFDAMMSNIQNSKRNLSMLAKRLGLALENIQEQLLEPWAHEPVWRNFTVNKASADALWQNFYNNIKDPSWPNCPTQMDFESLPDWIQSEIVTTHCQHK